MANVEQAAARAWALLGAMVGLSWGPPIAHFTLSIWELGSPLARVGLLLVTALAIAIGWLLPSGYYAVHDFERDGRVYVRLGIGWFKQWMIDGDRMNRRMRRIAPGYRAVRGDRDSLAVYLARVRATEQAHLIWMLATLPASGYALLVGRVRFAAIVLALNVITNLYPIWLQRYNRTRLARTLDSQDRSDRRA